MLHSSGHNYLQGPTCTPEQAEEAYQLIITGHSAPVIALELGLPVYTVHKLRVGRIKRFRALYEKYREFIPRYGHVYRDHDSPYTSVTSHLGPEGLYALWERYGLGMPMKLPDLDLHRKLNRARDEVEARLALDVDKFWEPPPRKERDPFDAQMLKPHLSKGQLRDMYRRRRQGETVLAIAAVYNLSEHRTCAILKGGYRWTRSVYDEEMAPKSGSSSGKP